MSKGSKVAYWILIFFCNCVGKLPFGVLYNGVAGVIYFCIYRLIGYRLKVVRKNLKNSFPEKSKEELREIEVKFYKNLAEVFIDTIVLCTLSNEEIKRRFNVLGAAEHEKEVAGKSWICAMAHFGSWEYTCSYKLYTDHTVFGVYHPLHSPAFEKFFMYTRTRFGSTPLPMHNVARQIVTSARSGEKFTMALIADQTPPFFEIDHWFRFLNQDTGFFMGTEKLAHKFNLPVYFLNVRKIAPAHYECYFEKIYNGTDKLEQYEITQRYVERLEQMILRTPEQWLWSHKRWKHKQLFSEIKENLKQDSEQ